MKASELRELTADELNSKHKELKEEFMRIRCNTVLSADSDVHQIKKTRKDIARINTILNEKNRTIAAEKIIDEKG